MNAKLVISAAAAALLLGATTVANAAPGVNDFFDYDGGMTLDTTGPGLGGGGGGGGGGGSGVGLSFKGISQVDVRNLHNNSSFIPPDTMGAVGATQFMETSNGAYAVYNKSTGALQSLMRDGDFWTAAGDSGSAAFGPGFNNGDSRVLFDSTSQRWVVESFGATDDQIHIAVSQTSDALGAWKAVHFEGFQDTMGTGVADYPTLAIDGKAIYIGTNDFTESSDTVGACGSAFSLCGTTLNVISRNDIFNAAGPSTASLKQFYTPVDFATDKGFAIQGVNQVNGADNGQILATSLYDYGTVHYNVVNPGTAGAVETPSTLIDDTPYDNMSPGRQPDGSRVIDTLDPRISSSVYEFNGLLYSVRTITPTGTDHTAVQWYVIDPTTNTVIQSGLIQGAGDFYQGSIAVSSTGEVVIGYNKSSYGPNGKIAIFARKFRIDPSTGALHDNGGPILLQTSPIDDYHNGSIEGSPPSGRQRWGDYSQVTVDPNNANSFWIIGEYADNYQSPTSFSRWGTWISQLGAPVPEPATWASLILGLGVLGGAMRRRRSVATA